MRPIQIAIWCLLSVSRVLCIVTKRCKIGLWCVNKSKRNVWLTFRLLPGSIPCDHPTGAPSGASDYPPERHIMIQHWNYGHTVENRAKVCCERYWVNFAFGTTFDPKSLQISYRGVVHTIVTNAPKLKSCQTPSVYVRQCVASCVFSCQRTHCRPIVRLSLKLLQ